MKRIILLTLVVLLVSALVTGCGYFFGPEETEDNNTDGTSGIDTAMVSFEVGTGSTDFRSKGIGTDAAVLMVRIFGRHLTSLAVVGPYELTKGGDNVWRGTALELAEGNYLFYAWAYDDDSEGVDPGVLYYGVTGTEVTIIESQTTSVQITASAIAEAEIELRSIGPAGGWIFYDAGSTQSWGRYLEAAPASTGWTSKQWGKYSTLVGGTGVTTGTGKNNTALIVAKLNQDPPDSDRAAQLCYALLYNGYEDWFLPSEDELNLMYVNLYQNSLGGFASDIYWSSSEDNSSAASSQAFWNGSQNSSIKSYNGRVRAVRAF